MTLQRLLLAPITALLLLSSGCMTAGVSSPVERDGPRRSDHGATFFWGITDAVLYAEECEQGLAEARTQLPWYAYIVSPLTLGIVNPVERQYYCAGL